VERTDYPRLLDAVLAEYREDPRWRAWRFETHVDARATLVHVVSERWRELLRNLIDNAVVQPSSDRSIAIDVTREASHIVTRVRDHGPGISEGNRDKVFRRFFTQRPKDAEVGTGLGLSIVAAIASAHGGSVRLEPSTDGACFVITLPAR
jgi:two-component system sensor histidine kinase ChvG